MSIDDMFERPDMPAAPRRLAAVTPASKPRITFGAVPDDVVDTLQGWGQGASATAVLVMLVRHLREPQHAALRARILADATEYAREKRRRRPSF